MSASHLHSDTPTDLATGEHNRPMMDLSRMDDPAWRLSQTTPAAGCTRLVVVTPDGGVDTGKLVSELAALAAHPVAEIIFVELRQRIRLNGARRRLDGLVSEARRIPVVVRRQVVEANSWTEAARMVARPGDLIVCQAGQMVGGAGQRQEEIASLSVHLLPSLRPPLVVRLAHGLGRLAFELLPLAIVATFFWLQVQIDSQMSGLISMLVITLTVTVEIGLIFVWSLFVPR